jgi:hypothetical protein
MDPDVMRIVEKGRILWVRLMQRQDDIFPLLVKMNKGR